MKITHSEDFLKPTYRELGSHQELYERYEEAIATCAVLKNALKRMVKYQMTGKKCLETAAQTLKEIG